MVLAALAVLLCVGSDAMGRTGELFTVQAETGKVTRLEPGGLAYLLPEDPDLVITYRPGTGSWRRTD